MERDAELLANVKTLLRDAQELNRQQKALWDRFDGKDGITREIESVKLESVKSRAEIDAKFTEKFLFLERQVMDVRQEEMKRDFSQRMQVAQLTWKVSIVIGGILFALNVLTRSLDLKKLFGDEISVASKARNK